MRQPALTAATNRPGTHLTAAPRLPRIVCFMIICRGLSSPRESFVAKDRHELDATTYDFKAISPTTMELDTTSKHHNMPSQMHGIPSAVQTGQSQVLVDDGSERCLHNYIVSLYRYNQEIPMDNAGVHEAIEPYSKQAEPEAYRIGVNADAAATTCPISLTTFEKSSGTSLRKSRKYSRVPDDGVVGDKKDEYRKKNRIAAAKCRVRKKEQADLMEDICRTQSALNTALKQTEKSLRDELSFWRTQAMQHTFCGCHGIQNYNLRKAQSMAVKISHTTIPCSNIASNRFSSPSQNVVRSQLGPEKGSSIHE